MDLDKLRIKRGAPAPVVDNARRPRPWGLILGLPFLGIGLWLFGPRLLDIADQLRLPTVEVAKAVRRDPAAAGALSGAAANGYIVARTRAALSADAPGRIVELNVEEGSLVSAGDVVARLYWREHEAASRRAEADLSASHLAARRAGISQGASQAAVAEAASHVQRTRADLERVGELVESGFENQSALDSARDEARAAQSRLAVIEAEAEAAAAAHDQALAQVEAARATRDLALATLEKTYLRAPFTGVVVLKDAEVGEVVSPNSTGGSNARGSVVTMVDFASLEVQADVPETSLERVTQGASATIYLDAWPGQPYKGSVSRIWPTADRIKGTVEVRVLFDQLDERLRPDMGVRVVFNTADQPTETSPGQGLVLVPAEALTRRAGQRGVFSLEGDRVRWRRVVVARESGGRAAIEAGLEEGETVVLAPAAGLADGERVIQAQ